MCTYWCTKYKWVNSGLGDFNKRPIFLLGSMETTKLCTYAYTYAYTDGNIMYFTALFYREA